MTDITGVCYPVYKVSQEDNHYYVKVLCYLPELTCHGDQWQYRYVSNYYPVSDEKLALVFESSTQANAWIEAHGPK